MIADRVEVIRGDGRGRLFDVATSVRIARVKRGHQNRAFRPFLESGVSWRGKISGEVEQTQAVLVEGRSLILVGDFIGEDVRRTGGRRHETVLIGRLHRKDALRVVGQIQIEVNIGRSRITD